MQSLDLDSQLKEWTLDAKTLALNYGYKIEQSGDVERVTSAPRMVLFCKKEFIANFIYSKNKLKHIELIPIIENVDIPNYPSEEYQSKKINYCNELLKRCFGDRPTILPDGVQWITEKYTIGCYAVNTGKDKYTGGNISIDMKHTS